MAIYSEKEQTAKLTKQDIESLGFIYLENIKEYYKKSDSLYIDADYPNNVVMISRSMLTIYHGIIRSKSHLEQILTDTVYNNL